VIDLAHHDRVALAGRLAHRWPGFDDPTMTGLLIGAGVVPGIPSLVPGPLDVKLWTAKMPVTAAVATFLPDFISQDAQ
jgi:ArsR family transcriptional regulator